MIHWRSRRAPCRRFSGGSHGIVVGHVVPEAQLGGPIALVEEGGRVVIGLEAGTLDLGVDGEVLAQRRAAWLPPAMVYSVIM